MLRLTSTEMIIKTTKIRNLLFSEQTRIEK